MTTAAKSSLENKHLSKRDYLETSSSDSHSIMLTKNTTNRLVAVPLKQIYIERTTDLLLCVQVVAKLLTLKTSCWYLTDYVNELH